MLTPKGYPFFAKRPPLDHDFFESFNRDNVKLVDINQTGTAGRDHRRPESARRSSTTSSTSSCWPPGFRRTPALRKRCPSVDRGGLLLQDKWEDVSSSIMGVFVAEFPNLFMITGPQAPFANLPTSIEQNIVYIVDCIKKMKSEGYDLCVAEAATLKPRGLPIPRTSTVRR